MVADKLKGLQSPGDSVTLEPPEPMKVAVKQREDIVINVDRDYSTSSGGKSASVFFGTSVSMGTRMAFAEGIDLDKLTGAVGGNIDRLVLHATSKELSETIYDEKSKTALMIVNVDPGPRMDLAYENVTKATLIDLEKDAKNRPLKIRISQD